jgi:hypothetical protein
VKRIHWLWLVVLVSGCARWDTGITWIGQVRFAAGDSLAWAEPRFDDSHWAKSPFWGLPRAPGILWVRARVTLPHAPEAPGLARMPRAVWIAALTSHEVWWDGRLIGRGGRVGATPAAEVPGPIEASYSIPDSLSAAGTHLIALRTSAQHRGFSPPTGYWRAGVGPFDRIVRERWRGAWIALTSLSGILIGALLAFVMFALHPQDRSALLLGSLGIVVAALLCAEAWRPLLGYSYDHHIVRLVVICALTCGFGVLLAAFVTTRFPLKSSTRALAVAAPLIIAPPFLVPGWDVKASATHFVAFGFAGLWTAFAVARRRRGAWPALGGIVLALVCLGIDPPAFLDRGLYFAVDALLACLLVGHLLVWRDETTAHERALARSARFEAELLKRHLQPHFVMNTLTAIAGWIEEDPPTAVRMIDALSTELRVLNGISDRKLIPMGEELKLCRAHLETLGLRRDRIYRLETRGVEDAEPVPPALIHTLLENAVTHAPNHESEVSLQLTAEKNGGRSRYVFTSPLGPGARDDLYGGVGTRYITARLREAWGDDWTLSQQAVGDRWRVEIEVPSGSA